MMHTYIHTYIHYWCALSSDRGLHPWIERQSSTPFGSVHARLVYIEASGSSNRPKSVDCDDIQVEMDPLHAALATKLIEWAGLKDKVTVVIGESSQVIPTLRERCV